MGFFLLSTKHIRHNCQLLVALLDPNSSNRTPAMRYDDWDVILFPKDSHVPIQEFKTACYVSPEECEYPALPHLHADVLYLGVNTDTM